MSYLNKHLESVDESYLEHLGHAWRFAVTMLIGALACAIHGLLPFLFEKTGSDYIKRLHDRMVVNRAKTSDHLQPAIAVEVN